MGHEGIQQNNEALKYLEPTPDEIFKARNEIQVMLMSREFGFKIDDDPDPEKNEVEGKWIAECAVFIADSFREKPELLMKYLHGDSSEVVDTLFAQLKERQKELV